MKNTTDAASPIDIPVMPCHCLRCDTEVWEAIPHKTRWQLLPPDVTQMYVCAVCGCKRCPHSDDHRNACTDSNEPGQPGSRYPARHNAQVTGAAPTNGERSDDL